MLRAFSLIAVLCCLVSLGCRPATPTKPSANKPKPSIENPKPANPGGTAPNLTATTQPASANPASAPPKVFNSPQTHPTATAENAAPVVDWPQFRGPSMLAMDLAATVPIRWSSENGLVWQVEVIEGVKSRGASSPIVFGDRIFLTAFTGCGTTKDDRNNVADLQHHVICLDKLTGEQLWQRTIQGSFANRRLSEHALGHGYASSTPVIAGERLFAFFGASGVFAFDLEGNFLWQSDVGSGWDDFGSSASLSVFKDLVFVNASVESQTLYALNQSSGKVVWKLDDVIKSWCTPVVATTAEGGDELIISQENTVRGLNPLTGEVLWTCDGIPDYTVANPIAVDGVCYLTGGREHQCLAIKLGGRGDVTATHKLWQVRGGSNISSPVYHQGNVYTVSANGIMLCSDAKTGKQVLRQRMGVPQQILASPVILGDHLFVPSQNKGVVVMNLLDDCKVVSRNAFAEDDVPLQASIAVSNNQLFLRTDNFVYCVGHPASDEKRGMVTADGIIIPKTKHELDEKTGRPKTFIRCLVTDEQAILDFMLVPYKSVITPEQTAKSTEFILANHQPFIDLRKQYLDLKWEYMSGQKSESEFTADLAKLEEQTMQHNYKVRKFIKDMFSKEQMDQHLREAGIIPKKTK